MNSNEITEMDLEDFFEIQQLYVHMSDKVMDLQITDHFISSVERRFLQVSEPSFDASKIRVDLQELEGLTINGDADRLELVKHQLEEGAEAWRSSLESRDQLLEAYHLRRFCDDPSQKLERMVFSALTRFYRDLPYSPSNLSKFDLVITRLFSKIIDPPFRKLLIDRGDLAVQLAELFIGWDYADPQESDPQAGIFILAKLEDFANEARSFSEFQELINSKIFDRIREFKTQMGELYFDPVVTSAAIECNIAVGNAFNALLTRANEPLSSKISASFDLAGAFQDTSPNADSHLRMILAELRDDDTELTATERRVSSAELMELVFDGPENKPPADPPKEPRALKLADSSNRSAQKRLEPLFFTLSQPEPDFALLHEHMGRFKAIEDLDLSDFIGSPEDQCDHLRRNVLGVILWIEELCENELNQQAEMTSTLKNELHRLLRKSEEFSEELDYLVKESDRDSQRDLLIVSNKLLEARLKLKRGIVRITKRKLAPAPKSKDSRSSDTTRGGKPKKRDPKAVPRTNRWLIAAAIIVSIASAVFYGFDRQTGDLIPPSKGVEWLTVKRIPKGESLLQAFRVGDMVIVTADDSWAAMPAEEQIESLKALKEYPSDTEVHTVIVTDGMGRLLGDVTNDGIRILEKLQVAENDSGGELQVNP